MIQINDFSKRYRHASVELNELALPEKCLLNGVNGCGKSTLFKACAGLVDYQGRIAKPVHVFYMPVEFPLPQKTLGAFIPFLKGDSRALFHDFFQVDQYALTVSECSTGMRQKLRLIYALSWPADHYLLDEPLHGLDVFSAKWSMRVLRAIKTPVSVITHTPAVYPGWPVVNFS